MIFNSFIWILLGFAVVEEKYPEQKGIGLFFCTIAGGEDNPTFL